MRKTLADGTHAEYHYAWRGGPLFWSHDSVCRRDGIEYVEAWQKACQAKRDVRGSFQEIINEFTNSSDFARLAARTRRDHLHNLARPGGIEEEFGAAPIMAFENARIRNAVLRWRDRHSDGVGNNMMATLQRVISFAYDRGLLHNHHLLRVKKHKRKSHAHIIWTQEEIDHFVENSPAYVGRMLIAAVETGFRPGDLKNFKKSDITYTRKKGARALILTEKSGRTKYATVPVTERLQALLDDLPEGQDHVIVGARGAPLNLANLIGREVSKWRDKLGIRKELRFYDARGNAVTRLVRAGCSIAELAAHMGWSMQHAAHMLDIYAALDPNMTDGILAKVQRQERLSKRDDEGDGGE
ncbi:tyrosine-type recombinase/integrase [Leisingera sp. XS_AS12]|uniref:tyrosine-type recombinase/integrase n=1 Tax=Leisingera sp. XS_AS12 TaxID=3241294 RepID=UPI003518B694